MTQYVLLPLQLPDSDAVPLQGMPACVGLVQLLSLLLVPWPQLVEHWDQASHVNHAPSTGKQKFHLILHKNIHFNACKTINI